MLGESVNEVKKESCSSEYHDPNVPFKTILISPEAWILLLGWLVCRLLVSTQEFIISRLRYLSGSIIIIKSLLCGSVWLRIGCWWLLRRNLSRCGCLGRSLGAWLCCCLSGCLSRWLCRRLCRGLSGRLGWWLCWSLCGGLGWRLGWCLGWGLCRSLSGRLCRGLRGSTCRWLGRWLCCWLRRCRCDFLGGWLCGRGWLCWSLSVRLWWRSWTRSWSLSRSLCWLTRWLWSLRTSSCLQRQNVT